MGALQEQKPNTMENKLSGYKKVKRQFPYYTVMESPVP